MTSAKESAVLRPFRGSAIGSAVVLLVSFVTLWFGFWQATATSFAAVACRRIVAKSHEIDCNARSRSASDHPVMGNAPPQD